MTERDGAEGRQLLLKRNVRNKVDGLDLLRSIKPGSAALVICDPQYRGVLDKLKFGNEGKRQVRRAALPSMDDKMIGTFLAESQRALRPSGHLVLWADKFSIASGKHLRWITSAFELRLVDMIAWNTTVVRMGKRTRGATEYAVILQKEPKRAKGYWQWRTFLDSWTEAVDRSEHPHAKPHQLTVQLIRATTKRDDLVVDPCAGGYGVLDACVELGREFLGGEHV